MNIQKKTLIIISSAFILMIALIAVASRMIVLESFRHLEEQNMRINMGRAESEISSILEFLKSTASDWAHWNETYEFVQNPGREYIESNLSDESMSALKLNFMVFVNLSRQVIEARFIDWETRKEMNGTKDILKQLMSIPSLHKHSDEKSVTAGILKGRDFPILTVSKPILTNEAKGPIRGSLIIGRFLDSREIQRISSRIHLKADILACSSPNLPGDVRTAYERIKQGEAVTVIPVNPERISAYAVRNDVMGKPAYILKVGQSRDVYQLGRKTVFLYIFTLLVIGLLFETMAKYLGVRYVYEDSGTAEAKKFAEKISADFFRTLSADVCMKLKKAAAELDSEMIRQIIGEIRQSTPLLADRLSELADNYEYAKIADLVSHRI